MNLLIVGLIPKETVLLMWGFEKEKTLEYYLRGAGGSGWMCGKSSPYKFLLDVNVINQIKTMKWHRLLLHLYQTVIV